jgi:hypothetical protein
MERNYQLEIGDVILVTEGGYGLCPEDEGKYVEVVGFGNYFDDPGVKIAEYQGYRLFTLREVEELGTEGCIGYESFGEAPMILLNTNDEFEAPAPTEELVKLLKEDSYCLEHYNLYYTLTEKDIKAGKIKVDAYWVAKQWKTGSRDDSGALWHSLKTIARFGEKNDKAREIKALYNQAIALARIYDVEL